MDSNFINNIIPRLRRFAVNTELKETLIDKIWEIFDDPKNVYDYQFLRDKRFVSVPKKQTVYNYIKLHFI